MSQSIYQGYTHFIFSTKYRDPLILPDYEKEIFSYIGGISNHVGSQTLSVGGFLDHVHILCKMSKNISVAEYMKKVKGNSSKWVKSLDPRFANFYWQNGYVGYSVDAGRVSSLIKYIQNQKKHHLKNKSYQNEARLLMKENGIEYDENYIWD